MVLANLSFPFNAANLSPQFVEFIAILSNVTKFVPNWSWFLIVHWKFPFFGNFVGWWILMMFFFRFAHTTTGLCGHCATLPPPLCVALLPGAGIFFYLFSHSCIYSRTALWLASTQAVGLVKVLLSLGGPQVTGSTWCRTLPCVGEDLESWSQRQVLKGHFFGLCTQIKGFAANCTFTHNCAWNWP